MSHREALDRVTAALLRCGMEALSDQAEQGPLWREYRDFLHWSRLVASDDSVSLFLEQREDPIPEREEQRLRDLAARS